MFNELKKRVLAANLALYNAKLAILTWGNVSEKSRDGQYFAITPSGVAYATMTSADIVILNLQGHIIEGKLNPSSDAPTHLELYNKFSTLKAIVHVHAPYSVAWAQAGHDIPCYGTTHADHFYGPIPCTRALTKQEIKGDYEQATGKVIIEEFTRRDIKIQFVPGVLVKNHGAFTFSTTSVAHAVEGAQILEEVAKMALYSQSINPTIKTIASFLQDKHYQRKHGKDSYYGQKKN